MDINALPYFFVAVAVETKNIIKAERMKKTFSRRLGLSNEIDSANIAICAEHAIHIQAT